MLTIRKPIVILDVDGVIRDVMPSILECFNKTAVFPVMIGDVKKYDLDFLGDKKVFFTRNAERIFRDSPAYHESMSAIWALMKNYDIKFVSSQYEEVIHHTVSWFVNHNLPTNNLYFTWDKSIVKSDVIVDDCPDNLKDHPAKHRFIFDQGYNRECKDYERVFSLYHLIYRLRYIYNN